MITETFDGEYYFRYVSEMRLDEKLALMTTLFEGMGYDFEELKMMQGPPENDPDGLWDIGSIWLPLCYTYEETIASYEANIEVKIKDIVSQRGVSFGAFEKLLKDTELEDYTSLLFITLAEIKEESYHPKTRYQYKSPSEKQRKLIKKMINIYPYTDKVIYKLYHKEYRHQEEPNKQKQFEVTLEGYKIRVNNYEQQKAVFELLSDEYKKQGLHQRFPYGEKELPDSDNPFPITQQNLEEQKKGNKGGQNKRNFIRDLAYRIHYLMHIKEWFEDVILFEFDDICPELEESILQHPFTKGEAELIAQLLYYFDIYDGQRKGKGKRKTKVNDYIQNLYMLIRTGEPQTDIIDQIEQLHPSYIRAMEKFYENENGGE